MARIAFTGFELGVSTELFGVSGTNSWVTSPVRSGTYAFRANPTGTAVGYCRFGGVANNGNPVSIYAATTGYFRFYFRIATLPASGDEEFFVALNSASATKFSLRVNASGNIAAYDSAASLLATGTTALSTGTWYRIEVMVGTGASAAWEAKINGVSEISGSTANLLTTNNGECRLGKVTNRNGNSVDFYFDDLSVDNAAYPGDGAILLRTPNANGSAQTWSIGAGSGSHYQQVDEVPPDNATTYLLSDLTIGDAETEALESCASAGISGTINGAKAITVCAYDTSGNGIKTRIKSGGSTQDTAAVGGQTASWQTVGLLATTDPATGAAWTIAGLDAVEVGAVEQDAASKTRMTFAGMMVDFTPVAGGIVPTPYYRLLASQGNL